MTNGRWISACIYTRDPWNSYREEGELFPLPTRPPLRLVSVREESVD